MSSVPNQLRQIPQCRHERRQSSIPRPTSSQARSQSRSHIETARSLTPTSPTVPRIGSSNQPGSLPSQQSMHNGLSGVRRQLHAHNGSTKTLASIDQVLSSRSDNNRTSSSLPLPPQHDLPKSNTSTSLCHPKHNVTTHQQLMRPIHPSLPRSQTGGSLSCFSGAAPQSTPSPTKSEAGSAETVTQPVNLIDALVPSRLDEQELNALRQQSQERGWIPGQRRDAKSARQAGALPRSNTEVSFIRLPQITSSRNIAFPERTDSLQGFCRSNPTFQEHVGQTLLRRGENRVLSERDASDVASDAPVEGTLALTSSDPDENFGRGPDEEWDFNPKLVYFALNPATWAGRFSSICNRLKTSDSDIVDSNYDTRDAPHASGPPGANLESFEEADRRRKRVALAELRSNCRTNEGLRSFESFESRLREQSRRDGQPLSVSPPSSQGRQRRWSSGPGPGKSSGQRGIWQIGSASSSTTSSNNAGSSNAQRRSNGPGSNTGQRGTWQTEYASGSNASSTNASRSNTGDIVQTDRTDVTWRPPLPKSKTVTGNLARLRDSASKAPGTRSISNNLGSHDPSTKPGHSWQKPTVLEAQLHEKMIREQRVMAAAAASRTRDEQRYPMMQAPGRPACMKQGTTETVCVTKGSGTQVTQGGASGQQHGTAGQRRSSGAESVKKKFADSMQSATRRLRRSLGGSHDESGTE